MWITNVPTCPSQKRVATKYPWTPGMYPIATRIEQDEPHHSQGNPLERAYPRRRTQGQHYSP